MTKHSRFGPYCCCLFLALWLIPGLFFFSCRLFALLFAVIVVPRIKSAKTLQIDLLLRILLTRTILDLGEDLPGCFSSSSCDLTSRALGSFPVDDLGHCGSCDGVSIAILTHISAGGGGGGQTLHGFCS